MPQYNQTSAFPNPFGGPQAQTPYPMQVAPPIEQSAMVNALDMPQDPRARSSWYKRLADALAAQQAQQTGGGLVAPTQTGSGGGIIGGLLGGGISNLAKAFGGG